MYMYIYIYVYIYIYIINVKSLFFLYFLNGFPSTLAPTIFRFFVFCETNNDNYKISYMNICTYIRQ